MDYVALTEEERDLMLAEELHSQERQHFAWAIQAEREAQVLAELPEGDWPARLNYLRGKGRDDIARLAKTPEDFAEAQAFALRDFVSVRQKTAALERDRMEGFHAKALAQLPVTRRATAFAAAKTKRDEAEARALR